MDLLPQDRREMIRSPYKGHAGSAEEDRIVEEVVAYRKDHTSQPMVIGREKEGEGKDDSLWLQYLVNTF